MENSSNPVQVVEEGTPVIHDGLPPLPDWPVPVLMHGKYNRLSFICPHDDSPMENETTLFSFKAGTYSCGKGHIWERFLGDWHGHNIWRWVERPTAEESLGQQLAATAAALGAASASLDRLDACLSQVLTEEERFEDEREKAWAAVTDALRDAAEAVA